MNVDKLEEFRNNFFKKLKEEKEEKDRLLKQKQRNCWHIYVLVQSIKICKKCGKLI
jgi:hypothetical protein